MRGIYQGSGSAKWLRFALCVAAFSLFMPFARGQTIPALDAVRVASGLTQAVFATAPPGDYNRLFIVRQSGQINILNLQTGTVSLFLDISSSLRSGGEQGLLGMAFDPDYFTQGADGQGKFYLYFTVPGGVWGMGTTHVSQFSVDPNNSNVALPTETLLVRPQASPSATIPLTFDHPQSNHNAGWIGFSPRSGDDHNLYIATGDGGNGYDQDPTPTPTPPGHIEPGGNAQNKTTLLGKMLRVHINPATGTYSIPFNNPFINVSGARPEIFAYGLRNPYRDSFDRQTGRMFIGDVGQDTREEIDVQQPTNPGGGENYGWRLREGNVQTPGVGGPPPSDYVGPILDYGRSTGGTIIGGCVYRGKQIPGLRGVYVFGDYLNKKIFTLNYDGTTASSFTDITSDLFPTASGNIALNSLSGFGEDANGELYITDVGTGNVFKIVPVTPNVTVSSITRDPVTTQVVIDGLGVPFTNVTIDATQSMTQSFGFLATAPVESDGTFEFTDTTNLGMRFYQVTYP